MSTIRKSVGRGGTNQSADVRVIKELLNKNLPIPNAARDSERRSR